ncbi:serine hydrolase [Parasphingorhabdus sp.]|uniref:serine hydrolase domain-containing protein n=1 Tax=Parasphingorhabdus sp. TaxID=2709688 RepID=UPI0032655ACE
MFQNFNARIALLFSACTLVSCQHIADTSDAEVRQGSEYETRFQTFLRDPGNYAYAPMETIAGASDYLALPAGGEESFAPEALAEAQNYAAANRSSAFLIWHNGKLVRSWYAPDTQADTVLNSKSLSKPLTAIAVGRAIALGNIRDLDQPLSEIVTELKGKPKGDILVRHLLDMRTGLLDQGYSLDPAHPFNRAYLDPDHGQYILDHYPLIDPPGSRYTYNNATGDLIALVIEKATGRRYAEFIGSEILSPIGAQGGEVWLNREGGLAHSGCCMKLPAESWLRLAVLLAQKGDWDGKPLLPAGYVEEMRRGTAQNPSYGLGIWLGEPYREKRGFGAPGTIGLTVYQSEPFLDPQIYMFDGNSNQTVHISPKHKLVVLRMGATPPKDPVWDNAALPNILIRGLRQSN